MTKKQKQEPIVVTITFKPKFHHEDDVWCVLTNVLVFGRIKEIFGDIIISQAGEDYSQPNIDYRIWCEDKRMTYIVGERSTFATKEEAEKYLEYLHN